MKKSLIIGLFFVLVFTQVVSADSIELEIQTLAHHRLNIDFLDPDRSGGVNKYGGINENTGDDGVLSLEFSDSAEVFDISLFLMKESEVVASKTFTGVDNGQKVMLVITPQVVSIEENYSESSTTSTSSETTSDTTETEENTTETISLSGNESSNQTETEETTSENPDSSSASQDTKTNSPENQQSPTQQSGFFGPYSNIASYVIFGFLFVFVLFFIIGLFGRRLFKAKKGNVSVTKTNSSSKDSKKPSKDKKEALTEDSASASEVQKKLDRALQEIEELKKQKKHGGDKSNKEEHKKKIEHLQSKHKLLKDIKRKKHKIANQKKELQKLEDQLNEIHAKKDIV